MVEVKSASQSEGVDNANQSNKAIELNKFQNISFLILEYSKVLEMTTREIITFQFGNYSNYIGAHWWNVQEAGFNYDQSNYAPSDINHDVLFREGQDYRVC